MSTLPTCIQCGGKEFYVESGFYFCGECQIQSQDIHEQLVDGAAANQFRTTTVKVHSQKAEDESLHKKLELTSWEVLNYLLKGWIDELIHLGVDPKVKIVALQLWVSYLQKLEVAFTSTLVKKKPRLGFYFRTKDAELIYGMTNSQSNTMKNPFSSKGSASSQTSAMTTNPTQSVASARINKRKALAKALYEEESVVSDTSRSNITLDNLSTSRRSSTSKVRYTVDAKKRITKLFGSMDSLSEGEEKAVKYSTARFLEKDTVRHLIARNVFCILRLSLLICKSPVQLSDMFRWSREGYMSLSNLERLLPDSVNVTNDIKALLVNPINSWVKVTRKTYSLSQFLSLRNINVDVYPICQKLVEDLHLPEDINVEIRKLLNISMPTLSLSPAVNYEGTAVALIIFLLKFIFSLDGFTEVAISKAAKAINKGLECNNSDDKSLFIWSDWVEALEFRDAVLSKYHVLSRELWYPGANLSSTTPAFLGQWSRAPKQQTSNKKRIVKAKMSSDLEHILEPLAGGGIEPLKPSLSPSPSMIRQVAPLLPPLLAARLSSVLDIPSRTSLAHYFNPDRLSDLARDNGCKVRYGLATEFHSAKKYRRHKIRPNAKSFQEKVVISLTGDLSESDLDSRDNYVSISSSEDPDDPTYRPLRRHKRRKLRNTKKHESSDSSEESESEKLVSLSNMERLPHQEGNVAQRVDLNGLIEQKDNERTIMYIPETNYWRLEGSFFKTELTIKEFEHFARCSFSSSFLWLLRRASILIEQSMRDIYSQLVLVEDIYLKYSVRYREVPKRIKKKW